MENASLEKKEVRMRFVVYTNCADVYDFLSKALNELKSEATRVEFHYLDSDKPEIKVFKKSGIIAEDIHCIRDRLGKTETKNIRLIDVAERKDPESDLRLIVTVEKKN